MWLEAWRWHGTVSWGRWMTTVCPLACSYIHGIRNGHSYFFFSSFFCWRAISTHIIVEQRDQEEGGPLWGGSRRCSSRTSVCATHSHKFSFQNMQSTIKQCNIDHRCVWYYVSRWHWKQRQENTLGGIWKSVWEIRGEVRVERKQQGGIIQTGSRCDSSSGQSGKR